MDSVETVVRKFEELDMAASFSDMDEEGKVHVEYGEEEDQREEEEYDEGDDDDEGEEEKEEDDDEEDGEEEGRKEEGREQSVLAAGKKVGNQGRKSGKASSCSSERRQARGKEDKRVRGIDAKEEKGLRKDKENLGEASFDKEEEGEGKGGPTKDDWDEKEIRACKICFEHVIDCALKPCGHLSSCVRCTDDMKMRDLPCPVCRTTISGYFPVFWS